VNFRFRDVPIRAQNLQVMSHGDAGEVQLVAEFLDGDFATPFEDF
jgi:hypothetical protein